MGIIRWPLGGSISSRYGDTAGRPAPHGGTDIRGRNGAVITAGAAGRVHRTAWWTKASGNAVTIIYPVEGGDLYVIYCHVTSKYLVVPGNTVKSGTPIAHVGASGNSKGGHVHIDAWLNGRRVNPEHYLSNGGFASIGEEDMPLTAADLNAIWGVTVKRGGGRITALQELADAKTYGITNAAKLGALESAVKSLAAKQGIDPVKLSADIDAAVANALADVTVDAELDADDLEAIADAVASKHAERLRE